MGSSSSPTTTETVTEIMKWHIIHPRGGVKLFFHRKANCEKRFTCISPSYTGDKPLFISCESLAHVFNDVWTWEQEKFVSGCDIINEWGKNISGGGVSDLKRITLVFSVHNNIESVDIRHWWRPSPEGVFIASNNGFSILGRENIKAFIKMAVEIEKRMVDVEKLEGLINRAYGLLFDVYNENYMFYPLDTPVVNVLDNEKFTCKWVEAMELAPYKNMDLKMDADEIFAYIIQNETQSLTEYIKNSKVWK